MANEFRHSSADRAAAGAVTQAEFDKITAHGFDGQATGDIPYASSATQISRLGIGANLTTVLSPAAGIPSWAATLTSLLFSSHIGLGTNPALAGAIRLANNVGIKQRNAANTDDLNLVQADGSNVIQVGDSGATLKLVGNLGLYSTTPVAQHSTTGQTAGFTAGVGTAVNDDSTFTGGSGTKAYTIGDVVRALKNIGLMAAS